MWSSPHAEDKKSESMKASLMISAFTSFVALTISISFNDYPESFTSQECVFACSGYIARQDNRERKGSSSGSINRGGSSNSSMSSSGEKQKEPCDRTPKDPNEEKTGPCGNGIPKGNNGTIGSDSNRTGISK